MVAPAVGGGTGVVAGDGAVTGASVEALALPDEPPVSLLVDDDPVPAPPVEVAVTAGDEPLIEPAAGALVADDVATVELESVQAAAIDSVITPSNASRRRRLAGFENTIEAPVDKAIHGRSAQTTSGRVGPGLDCEVGPGRHGFQIVHDQRARCGGVSDGRPPALPIPDHDLIT